MRLHRREYRLRYDDVDGRGLARPAALLDILEDAAASHCEDAGWSVFRLMQEGFGWVLLRGGLEMLRYPRYHEEMAVETWVSGDRRFSAEREYLLVAGRDGAREVLGFARGQWLFCDLARRRPASILPDFISAWAPGGGWAGPLELTDIEAPSSRPAPEGGDISAGFAVRSADIDTNGHVNNVVYLGWALEALPREERERGVLRRIRGQWKRELTMGASASPWCEPLGAGRYRLGVYGSTAADGGSGADSAEPWLAAAAETEWTPLAI